MRLGAKTKKALRIGAKVGAVAGAVALGTKGRRSSVPTAQELPQATQVKSPSGLVSKTGELKSQSQDFASMATELRKREEAKSRRGFSSLF